jgi:heme/copper-type cytochrome/quinol oxidase subunit 2
MIKRTIQYITTSLLLASPLIAFAQVDIGSQSKLSKVINNITNFMSSLIVAASIIVILYASFRYITAAGNEEQVSESNRAITYAVVGLIVGLLAYTVPGLIEGILK